MIDEIKIRPIEKADYTQLHDIVERNRKRLLEYFPTTSQTIVDLETARNFTAQKIKQALRREQFYYVIEVLRTGEIIGTLMLKSIDWSVPKGEFAYFIDGCYEGKGITTYAVNWLKELAFEEMGMEKLFIKINPENWGSKKVALNNGFELEGVLKKEFRTGKGDLTDVERYGLVRPKNKA